VGQILKNHFQYSCFYCYQTFFDFANFGDHTRNTIFRVWLEKFMIRSRLSILVMISSSVGWDSFVWLENEFGWWGWKYINLWVEQMGRSRLVEIWWYVFSDEFVLHIFSSFNRSLSSSFPVFFQICPVWLACSVSFAIANLNFSALESGFGWSTCSCFVANLENLKDPLNNQNNPDGYQKLIRPWWWCEICNFYLFLNTRKQ